LLAKVGLRESGATRKTGIMDDHAAQSTRPYPPPAVGLERKLLEGAAATGILLIAAAIATMGLAMYLLPNAPPNFVALPLF
jgi:hypothetical protein